MSKSASTMKEALIAHAIEDLAALLDQVESLKAGIAGQGEEIAGLAGALDASGERFKATIHDFTEQAKNELNSHLDRQWTQASLRLAMSTEEMQATMQNAAIVAFRAQSQALQPPRWQKLVEYGFAAAMGSICTLIAVYSMWPK